MRYGIFSDVHSNREAFEAVLQAYSEESIDRFYFVGDIVGYAADPSWCIGSLRELGPIAICGNHDRACAGLLDMRWFTPIAKEAAIWTSKVLTQEERQWLKGLQLVHREATFTLVHGSLDRPEDFKYIIDTYEAGVCLALSKSSLCLVGHSHAPAVFFMEQKTAAPNIRQEVSLRYSLDSEIQIRPGYKYLINVGSVGQPRDGDPRACYTIYDADSGTFQIKRIEYDIARAQEKILKAGLPSRLASRLAVGR